MEIIRKQLTREIIFRYLNDNSDLFTPPLKPRINLEEFSEKIARYATHFSAIHNNAITGLMACYLNDPKNETGFITTFSVARNFQNRGIAKKLFEEGVSYAKSLNYKKLRLEVFKQNLPAIAVYQKMKFFISEEKETSYYMDLILLPFE